MRTTTALVSLALLVSISSGCVSLGVDRPAPDDKSAAGLPFGLKAQEVHTYVGNEIVITDVRGDSREYRPGATYLVSGHYRLRSHREAVLTQWCSNGWVQEVDSKEPEPQHGGSLQVKRGEGEFSFRFKVKKVGALHLSFYPADGGDAFASLYYAPTSP